MDEREAEDVSDRLSRVEAVIEHLQAELEWVKVALQGRVPAQSNESTKPPVLGPVLVAAIGAVGAIVAAKPWA